MQWEIVDPDDPRFATCGEARTKSGIVKCEYPPSHDEDHHFGRGQTGRWYSWPKIMKEDSEGTPPVNNDSLIDVIENTRKQTMAYSARVALKELRDYGRASFDEVTLAEFDHYAAFLQRVEAHCGDLLTEALTELRDGRS